MPQLPLLYAVGRDIGNLCHMGKKLYNVSDTAKHWIWLICVTLE